MKIINSIKVKSSNVDTIGYHKKTSTLRVQFLNGGVYDYDKVEEEIYNELKRSRSAGKFLNSNVKNIFVCKKVDEIEVIEEKIIKAFMSLNYENPNDIEETDILKNPKLKEYILFLKKDNKDIKYEVAINNILKAIG